MIWGLGWCRRLEVGWFGGEVFTTEARRNTEGWEALCFCVPVC